jgi:DNA mismatch repair protein MSH5
VEGDNNLFQIRPAKEFSTRRGQERLQTLPILAKLNLTAAEDESISEPRSVYDFIRKKSKTGTDPTTARWNALVRLSNFYSAEERTPLCVGICPVKQFGGPFY